MILEIPTPSAPEPVRFFVELEQEEYGFSFRWNERADKWTLDILTIDEEMILGGVSLYCNIPLYDPGEALGLPPGQLVCVSVEGDLPPGPNELGENGRVTLLYITSDHVFS